MDKLLLQFKAIVEDKNMSKASERLYIDRSTLSKNMDSLEKKLNILLLKRTNKGVNITNEGMILYKSICEMNITYENTLNEIKSLSIHNNILNIGSDLAINYNVLLNTIARVQEDYPQMVIHVKQGTSLDMANEILNNEIDIFMGSVSAKSSNIATLVINEFDRIEYGLFLNNDNLLLRESHIDKAFLNDMDIFNWYSLNNSDILHEFLAKHKLKPHMKFTSADINMLLNVAKVDHKACVLLPMELMNLASDHNLGIYKPFDLTLEVATGIIYKNINQKQSLKIFLNKLF